MFAMRTHFFSLLFVRQFSIFFRYPEVFMRHHKDTPKVWVCPYAKCNKAYSMKSNMLYHVRAKHPTFRIPDYAQNSQGRSLPIPKDAYNPQKPAINLTPQPMP